MLQGLSKKLFGTVNERIVKAHATQIGAINDLERSLEALSDEELRAKTPAFRKRIEDGETLDDLLVEAFAVTREAAKRTLGQRHYDVQLVGGIVLHQGRVAEMATGEGKTLVATLPVYLNALEGKGVHVITVNDYLAQRDAAWMGEIYQFLGLKVGCIVHGLSDDQRRQQYGADVTYGTNNEFGFDYLRDNMKFTLETMVQRPFNFAIVDEVDSILIDEARTPLIISGPSEDSSEMYQKVDQVIPELQEGDFEIDEKARAATLTDEGAERVEALLAKHDLLKSPNLYDIENVSVVHHLNQAVRAHKMFERDTDYIVNEGRVVIIDEFTGRMMPGRRFSEGLHQALEAKENVRVQQENQTLASITFQNYFRMYPKLAGMTGTAATEAAELGDIYRLDVIQIPTNEPCIREDRDDEVYRTAGEKWNAIVELLRDCQKRGQPVLVGTTSIEKSELLSERLKKESMPHNVLNARYHEQEAHIIAQAGREGALTIATNMAGRGTDIQLGGNVEFRIADETRRGRGRGGEGAGRRQHPRRGRGRAREGARRRRTAGGGQRAPRGAAHRQPAARPLRPAGRPRRLALLPLPRRRPHADFRLRAHGLHALQARSEGRGGDRPSLDQQGAREGAAEGRGAQLRNPQEPPEVRRRDERPALRGLRAAQGPDAHRRCLGDGHRHAPGGGRKHRR